MDQTIQHPIPAVYAVDPEHAGVRLSIVVIFVVVWALIFALLNVLIRNDGINLLALGISFIITALATQQIEKWLKVRWPSGRVVQIDRDHIQIARKSKVQHDIDPGQQVNVLMWRFKISRRSRVPKGWYMLACALEQNEEYVPVYTFMSPSDFDKLDLSQHFTMLQSRKELERDKRENMRLAGAQRRLHAAEQVRWMDGAEMKTDDFKQFIVQLQEQFPQWMPAVI